MTATTTAPTSTTTPRSRRPQWVRSATYQASIYGYMMIWFWAIALPVVAIVMAIVSRTTEISASGMMFTHHAALWFPFSIGIAVTAVYLPLHVANGMTRRSFARAAVVAAIGIGLVNALVTIAALLVEEQIYGQLGWVHGVMDGDVAVFSDGVLPYLINLVLLFSAGQLSGLLIGLAYYRAGGWVGTLTLPLTLSPIAAVTLLSLGDAVQWQPFGVTLDWSFGAAVVLLVQVAAVLAILLIARNLPLATNKE